MKLKLLLISLCLFTGFISKAAPDHTGAFITVWDTDKMEAGQTFWAALLGGSAQYYWEKINASGVATGTNSGTSYTAFASPGSLNLTAVKAKSGIYRLYIKTGTKSPYFNAFSLGGKYQTAIALTKVESWGNINWVSMASMFQSCENLTVFPASPPNTGAVTSMSYMFYGAKNFNCDMVGWDIKNVTDMSYMFYGASSFNGNIDGWNVGKVSIMAQMFSGASSFNRDISNWNVSSVTNMSGMFSRASAFNQNISKWNVSNVNSMLTMFNEAVAFNQDLSSWDLTSVGSMTYMFKGATSFNQYLGDWKLKTAFFGSPYDGMLDGAGLSCSNYSKTLKAWAQNSTLPNTVNLGAVTGLKYAVDAQQYRDILTKPTNQGGKGWILNGDSKDNSCFMLDHTGAFITVWDTGKMGTGESFSLYTEQDSKYAYYWEKVGEESTVNSGVYLETTLSSGSYTLKIPEISAGTGQYRLYIKKPFKRMYFSNMVSVTGTAKALLEVEDWGNISWSNMSYTFYGCENLVKLPQTAPDLSLVKDMQHMFSGAKKFNSSINNWDMKNVTNITGMFTEAESFNQDLNNWELDKVTQMARVFYGAKVFNGNISNWKIGGTSLESMFYQANAFNGDISAWNTENITNMQNMFGYAKAFNRDISEWKVGQVSNMSSLFNGAEAFNQDISEWDISQVTNMSALFSGASSFNQNIGNWKTGKVTDMSWMFSKASTFNQDISGWNVESVTNMSKMFSEASAFDQDLSKWPFKAAGSYNSMLEYAGLSCTNYSKLLKALSENPNIATSVYWLANGLKYAGNAQQYRDILTKATAQGGKGWTISGDAVDASCVLNTIDHTGAFITIWNTDKLPDNYYVSFNTQGTNYEYYWEKVGDENNTNSGTYLVNPLTQSLVLPQIAASETGVYRLYIKAGSGTFTGFQTSGHAGQAAGLTAVESWGGVAWEMLDGTFVASSNLTSLPSEAPDLSQITDLSFMFAGAKLFNQDISHWDLSHVTDMSVMFTGAESFNQDISNWDVSKVTNMSRMFSGAKAFNQNLGSWTLAANVDLTDMLNNSGLSAENYGLTLKGWAENPNTPTGLSLGAAGLKYDASSQQYWDLLTKPVAEGGKGWTITDGGALPVTILTYVAKIQGGLVQINWQTATETNNSHFIIEKSADGIHFSYLERQEAKGPGTYLVYDKKPVNGLNYYRLTQYDKNGIATDHGVKFVKFEMQAAAVTVYPNPVSSSTTATVSFPAGVYTHGTITDLQGRTITTTAITVNQQNISIETTNLSSGIYFIRLSGKEQSVQKLIKQ